MSVGDRRNSFRRAVLLFPLFLSFAASPLAAATSGLDLAWDDCGSFGTGQKSFACGGGSARLVLVASAISGVDLPRLCGQYSILHVEASSSTLPAWWQLSAGGCRGGTPSAIHSDFDFTSGGGCADPWSGAAMGGMAYEAGFGGAARARIQVVCAIAGDTRISGSDEYAFFKIAIATGKTEACGGCTEGACIVLDSIELDQPKGVGDHVLTTPILQRAVQWQGGTTASTTTACPGAAVQTAKTWGGLKSLYRH